MKMVMESKIGTKEMDKQVKAIVGNEGLSKSQKMKELFRLGLEVKNIATMLGVRYNFVYNVVSNMVIIEGIKVEDTKTNTKKDLVWGLLDQGKTVKEIAVELKTNQQYIYKLKKEWEAVAEAEVKKMEAESQLVVGGNK